MRWITEDGNKTILKLENRRFHKSKRQDFIMEQIRRIFPFNPIYEEVSVPHTRLSFDIFIPTLNIVVEVDSKLHEKFVPHFHKTKQGFLKVKANDEEKNRLCNLNGIKIVRLSKNKYSDNEIKTLIME